MFNYFYNSAAVSTNGKEDLRKSVLKAPVPVKGMKGSHAGVSILTSSDVEVTYASERSFSPIATTKQTLRENNYYEDSLSSSFPLDDSLSSSTSLDEEGLSSDVFDEDHNNNSNDNNNNNNSSMYDELTADEELQQIFAFGDSIATSSSSLWDEFSDGWDSEDAASYFTFRDEDSVNLMNLPTLGTSPSLCINIHNNIHYNYTKTSGPPTRAQNPIPMTYLNNQVIVNPSHSPLSSSFPRKMTNPSLISKFGRPTVGGSPSLNKRTHRNRSYSEPNLEAKLVVGSV